MKLREALKSAIKQVGRLPYLGRLVHIAAAAWRGPHTRTVAMESLTRLGAVESLVAQHRDILNGYGAAIRGIEASIKRQEIDFAERLEHLSAHFAEKMKWAGVDSDNIRNRLEFIRKETMFELRKQLNITGAGPAARKEGQAPRFVNEEKFRTMAVKKLNLGCGHITKDDYINVDGRALPGVDLVSDVTSLPFEPASIQSIHAAHLVEHFSDHALRETVLPHWHALLEDGGELVLVAPDAEAMMTEYAKGNYSFDELREVMFGGQEYEGDFHFTMLQPQGTVALLKSIGFSDASIRTAARKNGACLEFEIHAIK